MEERTKVAIQSGFRVVWRGWLVVVCAFGLTVVAPRIVGGAYSVLGIPFYNLVCLTPHASSFPAALGSVPPSASDYLLFLNDQGCSADDLKHRNPATDDDPLQIPESSFWGNDVISNLFRNVSLILARGFSDGEEDTSFVLIPLLQHSVLAQAAYFLCYTVLVAILAWSLNKFLESRLRAGTKKVE
jgi:hypothetical protein